MNPAPSVIIFTVLSGMGFGFLAFLGLGVTEATGMTAFALWGLGYAMAVGGLLASTFHLGNPQRALRAFTQWRTSWLSREAWASVVTLMVLAPAALSDWLGLEWNAAFGWVGAALCFVTVYCTSMIYAQIRAVPRWNHWITPVGFLTFSLAGGLMLAGSGMLPALACVFLGAVMLAGWKTGDGLFAARGATLATATGLGAMGVPSVFELPHTGGNYLMHEMIHVVGRKHADKLRRIALLLAAAVPAVVLLVLPAPVAVPLAAVSHLMGAFAARWLFFAQAEHVVGLYYGQR
jgi:sulfite dehydrogenase (quinone) subunit SoeC